MSEYDVTLRLVHATFCSCGYLLMDTPVGTLYRAVSSTKHRSKLRCGGCGLMLPVTVILCEQKIHPKLPPALLVFDVMEVVPD